MKSLKNMLGSPDFPKSVIDKLPKQTFGKKEGIGEMVDCLLSGDFECFLNNVDWLLYQLLGSTVSCNLGPGSIDPIDPLRTVYSGSCSTWWGLPFVGNVLKCTDFDSAIKSVQACQSRCASEGKNYETAGCEVSTIWCHCRV